MSAALELASISHRFGDRTVLHDLDLSIGRGEFVGLIGPNGSGKTTLMQVAAGVLQPSAGTVRIGGIVMGGMPVDAKRELGMGIDPALLPPALSGRQVLELVAAVRGLPSVPQRVLDLARTLRATAAIDQAIGRCSLGQKQKIGVLAALIGDPPLVLLDEPFNGLDPLAAFELKEHLSARARSGEAAVLLSTHSLDIAERHIDRALLMLEGRLVRDWNRDALRDMREPGGRGLEAAMVDAIRESSTTT